MKLPLFLSLLASTAAPAVLAQAPATATVKTKVKTEGQPGVKTKTTSATAPAAIAGTPPSEEAMDAKANGLTTNMQQNLGLTPQQTEKVRVINRRSIGEVESGRYRYRAEPRKLVAVLESVGRSRLESLKDVLTPPQFDKYQRAREKKMDVPNVQGVQGNTPPGLGSGGGGDQ